MFFRWREMKKASKEGDKPVKCCVPTPNVDASTTDLHSLTYTLMMTYVYRNPRQVGVMMIQVMMRKK
jgi:hypothetical protein